MLPKNQGASVSSLITPSFQSKSKILYDSVESVHPLTGLVDAEEMVDAFRIACIDFQRDISWMNSKNCFFQNLKLN